MRGRASVVPKIEHQESNVMANEQDGGGKPERGEPDMLPLWVDGARRGRGDMTCKARCCACEWRMQQTADDWTERVIATSIPTGSSLSLGRMTFSIPVPPINIGVVRTRF